MSTQALNCRRDLTDLFALLVAVLEPLWRAVADEWRSFCLRPASVPPMPVSPPPVVESPAVEVSASAPEPEPISPPPELPADPVTESMPNPTPDDSDTGLSAPAHVAEDQPAIASEQATRCAKKSRTTATGNRSSSSVSASRPKTRIERRESKGNRHPAPVGTVRAVEVSEERTEEGRLFVKRKHGYTPAPSGCTEELYTRRKTSGGANRYTLVEAG